MVFCKNPNLPANRTEETQAIEPSLASETLKKKILENGIEPLIFKGNFLKNPKKLHICFRKSSKRKTFGNMIFWRAFETLKWFLEKLDWSFETLEALHLVQYIQNHSICFANLEPWIRTKGFCHQTLARPSLCTLKRDVQTKPNETLKIFLISGYTSKPG